MCHLILLLPLLALPVSWLWAPIVAIPVYLVVLAVSAFVYYLALVAMQLPVRTGREHLLDSSGKVLNVQDRIILVRVDSETWQAKSTDELHPGDAVKVVGIEGLQLKVRRLEPSDEMPSVNSAHTN